MNAIKRNQIAISGLILRISKDKKMNIDLINLLKTYNRQGFNRSTLFKEKNKIFNRLCKLQDILLLERKLESHYIEQQNKIEYASKYQLTHSIITNHMIRKDRKKGEKISNKIFIKAISDCCSNTMYLNY